MSACPLEGRVDVVYAGALEPAGPDVPDVPGGADGSNGSGGRPE
jgi:hypothetical protein